MKTTGLFTVHRQTIPCKPNQPIRLVLWGDVHRDSPQFANGKWKEFLKYARGLKDAWYLGLGDYLDSTSTTERECLESVSAKMHETFRNDVCALQMAKVDMLAKELAFMRGRIVGMLNGNHYFNFPSGINTDQKLCEKLEAKYLGACSLIRLELRDYHNNHKTNLSVVCDVFAHHGMGASRLVGGSANRVAQMAEGVMADIHVMGHDHKRLAVPANPRIYLAQDSKSENGLKLRQRETWVVRSGSFLAAYEPNTISYNVDACRPPSSLGWVEMFLTLKDNRAGGLRERSLEIRSLT